MDPVLTLPRGRPLTADDLASIPWRGASWDLVDECLVITAGQGSFGEADLDALPDDGWRHELVDGALVMSPSPTPRHQTVVVGMFRALDAACPEDVVVFVAPLDVRVTGRTDDPDEVFQPDVLVTRRADVTDMRLVGVPLLAVEIASPSTRSIDRTRKHARYARAGVGCYWIVDPLEPRLTAWELRDGVYVEVADTADTFTAALPYPVTIAVADLTR